MHQIFKTAFANLFLAVATAAVSILVARVFGAEVRGQYATFMAVANVSTGIGLLGYQARISLDFATVGTEQRPPIRLIWLLGAALSSTMAVIILYFSPLEKHLFLYLIVCAYCFFSIGSIVSIAIIIGSENWGPYNFGRMLLPLTLIGFSLFVWFLVPGADQYLFPAVLAGGAITALYFFANVRKHFFELSSTERLSTFMARGRGFVFNSIANASSAQADLLVVSFLLTPTYVGYWAVAKTVTFLMAPLNQAISITVFAGSAQKKRIEISKISALVRISQFMNLLLGVVLMFFGEAVLVAIFGGDFSKAVTFLPPLIAAYVFSSASDVIEEMYRGHSRPEVATFARVIMVAVFLLGAIFLWWSDQTSYLGLWFAVSQFARILFLYSRLASDFSVGWRELLIPKSADARLLLRQLSRTLSRA